MLVNSLKKKKPHYDDLNRQLQEFFLDEAKEQRKKDYGETDEDIQKLKSEVIIEDYINDTRRARPMITKALQKAAGYCTSYLDSKDDLAYLAYFRKKVHFSDELVENYKPYGTDIQTNHFQTSSSALIRYDDEEQQQGPSTVMNLFMCVKYKNSGKLSSHNWFFNGFCKELRPGYAVLLDVGLRPEGTALLKMYKYMHCNQNIGGVCGYMSLKMEQVD